MKIEFNDTDTPEEHAEKLKKLREADNTSKQKQRAEALDAAEPFVLALVGLVTVSELDNTWFQAIGLVAILLAFRRFLKG